MSQTKIITFLGTTARQTIYRYQEKDYVGEVFAQALREFCQYDTMLVCVTDLAKEETFPKLEALNDSRIKPIDIPTCRTTEEMWETFKIITQHIDESDRVIFDITHGLRSLPFLVFLFAAYLKAAKKVTIEAIYYGAFELSYQHNNHKITPVLDLSEFVSMLDWITATTRFASIGDGQPLAALLKNSIPSNEELKNYPETRPIKKWLKKSAQAIENISIALSVTRPIETMESAADLEKILEEATDSFNQRAKPFSLLSEKIVQEYGQFALKKPQETAHLVDNINLQLQMIKWYLDRDQIVQATTLAREWLISVLVLKFGLTNQMFDNKKGRKYVEDALNNASEKLRPNPRPITPSECDEQFNALPKATELAKVWSQMTELRNDIAHVGMNTQPNTAAKLQQKALSLYPKLEEIGGKHSSIQTFLAPAINQVAIPHKIARAFTELRCTFGGRSLVPDITVFSWERIPVDGNGEIENTFEIAPDWTIEILSPEQSSIRVINNILFCLNHGTELGWLIDPQERSILIFKPGEQPEIKQNQDSLPVFSSLGELRLSVQDVFSWLSLS
jgi:CRISPR-associated DxTHG motif protein